MNLLKGCIVIVLVVVALSQEPEEALRCHEGYCVSKLLCVNDTYVEDSKKLQDQLIVSLRINEIDDCEDYLLVCCKTDQPPRTTTEDPLDDDLDEPAPSEPVCGQHNPDGLSFNFEHNDTIAQYGEYPWVVYILTTEKKSQTDTYSFVCGGSLINPRFVVTTAHNTEGKSNLIARFGEWDTGTINEPYPQKEISVRDIIKHPEYVQNPIANDIALLLLAENVEYTRHIQPICLPQNTDNFVERRCISNGWGTVGGIYATIMKKVSLPVLSRDNCTRMLRYAGLGPRYQLAQGFMCAGGEHNIDTCKGDGGSPLACETESGSYVLAGIVSWGIGCGGVNFPGVYVEVSKYLQWINQHLEYECLGTNCALKNVCQNGTNDVTNWQNNGVITLRFSDDGICEDPTIRATPNEDDTDYGCGKNNIDDSLDRTKRPYALFGEFPWVVAIFETSDVDMDFIGTGNLIHPMFVLTVAHIVEDKGKLAASFGEWDMNLVNVSFPKQFVDIDPKIIMHSEYTKVGLLNDIALAKLQKNVIYREHIRPICLPNPGDVFDNQACISTGWGTEYKTQSYTNVLKRVELTVMPRKQCKQRFAATRLGSYFRLHKSVLCAGGEAGVDMCHGDGGSALMCPTQSGSYVLAGIVSWGLNCFQQDVPGAYVNVARFVDWIENNLNETAV
uniref:Phenoloxidase-activating factor 2 n=1 Tax=Anopheles dirus TaxID=7168 RepID=A0A182NCA8_9DIPT